MNAVSSWMSEVTTSTPQKLITVVLVEDYKLTRLGIRAIFSRCEHIKVVGEASDAEEGLRLTRLLKPNVVLMDLGLPDMNGIEATAHIKGLDKSIKVIVLTSHETEEDVVAALKAGADGYCLKDIEPARLEEAIKLVSQGHSWLDPSVASIGVKIAKDAPVQNNLKLKHENKWQLTEREMEVLRLVVEGKSNTEIAKELIVSVHTAKAHVCNILQKLYVEDRVQAAVKAIKEGIV